LSFETSPEILSGAVMNKRDEDETDYEKGPFFHSGSSLIILESASFDINIPEWMKSVQCLFYLLRLILYFCLEKYTSFGEQK